MRILGILNSLLLSIFLLGAHPVSDLPARPPDAELLGTEVVVCPSGELVTASVFHFVHDGKDWLRAEYAAEEVFIVILNSAEEDFSAFVGLLRGAVHFDSFEDLVAQFPSPCDARPGIKL